MTKMRKVTLVVSLIWKQLLLLYMVVSSEAVVAGRISLVFKESLNM